MVVNGRKTRVLRLEKWSFETEIHIHQSNLHMHWMTTEQGFCPGLTPGARNDNGSPSSCQVPVPFMKQDIEVLFCLSPFESAPTELSALILLLGDSTGNVIVLWLQTHSNPVDRFLSRY